MREHDVVLSIQDTTELDFNGRQALGLGPLSYEAPAPDLCHQRLSRAAGRARCLDVGA